MDKNCFWINIGKGGVNTFAAMVAFSSEKLMRRGAYYER